MIRASRIGVAGSSSVTDVEPLKPHGIGTNGIGGQCEVE